MVAVLTAVGMPLAAQQLPSEQMPPDVPPPVIGEEPIPSPVSPSDIPPPPPVSSPQELFPSPIAPSEPPAGAPPLPPLVPVPEGPEDFIDVEAESIRTEFDDEGRAVRTVATGNVVARYRNMAITSQGAVIDYRTNNAVFEQNVVFRIDNQEARGERLEVSIRTGQWEFFTLDTIVRPEFAQGLLRAPIFATASEAEGLRDRRLTVYDTLVTTCNLENEHYDLAARSMSVYPNSKIVLRDVTPYLLGRRLFTLPRIVIPLRDVRRNPNIIPRFGQTVEEGYFLKTSYAYMGTAAQTGLLLLDLMTRKGIGTGLRHTYNFSGANGEVELYRINDRTIDQNTFTGRLSHLQQFGTIKANLTSDFRSNSYVYAPESTSWTNRLLLTRDRPGARSSLVINQFIDDTFARTERLAGTLQHRQTFSPNSYLDTNFDYNAFKFQRQNRARLASQMVYSNTGNKFDWSVTAQELTDLSDESFVAGGGFAGIERLPEIAFATDSTRIGRFLPFGLPAKLRFSFGPFRELPSTDVYNRTFLAIDSPVQRYSLSDTWNLVAGAGFRQYVYDSDRAQYSVDMGAELTKRLGEQSTFALTYRYQRPRGFTPFRFDFIGRYNILNSSLNIQDGDRLRLSLLTGYNFEQKDFPWQDVVLRAAYQVTPSFLLYTATGYDINRSRWRAVINQFRIRAGNDFRLDIGTRYDTDSKQLGSIRAVLDTPLGSKTRLQAVAGYNGISNEFDYRSLRLTRDLHCWEVSLIYTDQGGFYSDKGITLNFRIKAFPLFENFGTGAFGQSLDTSVGQIY